MTSLFCDQFTYFLTSSLVSFATRCMRRVFRIPSFIIFKQLSIINFFFFLQNHWIYHFLFYWVVLNNCVIKCCDWTIWSWNSLKQFRFPILLIIIDDNVSKYDERLMIFWAKFYKCSKICTELRAFYIAMNFISHPWPLIRLNLNWVLVLVPYTFCTVNFSV